MTTPRVRSITIPFLTLVRKADKDWQKDRRKEPEYEFGGGKRVFTANRAQRGAYLDTRDELFDPYP